MEQHRLMIKNGRVIDPASKLDAVSDVLIEAGKVVKIASSISEPADKIIEAKGKLVIPGLVDMHVHLREPGREDKETVFSGTKAAAAGGVTSVLAMPNTNPAIDSVEQVSRLEQIINKTACVGVFIAAAISEKREGLKLTNLAALKKSGVIAISDDGSSVDDCELMRQALKVARQEKLLLISHCEDKNLSGGGSVNLGFTSTRMGLRGVSRESEYRRVERDIELAKQVKARIHIAHVSCKESVDLIAAAKKQGVEVTAETAPHYFSLTEEAVLSFDTNAKMNPPLRRREDRESVKEALLSGVIDVIASDHAPHTLNDKDIEFDRAEFGAIGLETELAVAITELVNSKGLSWLELVERMAYSPAKILGIDKGKLMNGGDADIAIISPQQEWVVQQGKIVSKSKNSCFLGRRLRGMVDYTIFQGKVVYQR